jgi:hypothetical protein
VLYSKKVASGYITCLLKSIENLKNKIKVPLFYISLLSIWWKSKFMESLTSERVAQPGKEQFPR